MLFKPTILLILTAICFANALTAKNSSSENIPEATVWVAHEFIGGPKCVSSGPVIHYTAPGFEREKIAFKKAKVSVLREYFRDLATCQACQRCPNYHRWIFFEIRAADLPLSDKIGYRKVTPPDNEELIEYEAEKRFRPKPDRPPED